MNGLLLKTGKIILLLLSLLPVITMALSFSLLGNDFYTQDPFFVTLFTVMFAAIPFQWIFYISNVVRNRTVTKNSRVIWFLFLLFGHIVAFPIYWFFHIWRDNVTKPPERIPSENARIITKNRTTAYKLIILCFSLLPLVLEILGVLFVLFYTISDTALHIFTYISFTVLVAVLLFYVVNVFRNNRIAQDMRVVWTVLFILGQPSVLVYWFLYIWRDKSTHAELN